MTNPSRDAMDWDGLYRQETLPPWSIGQPQPELAALIDAGKVHSDVLDSGCGHAALSLELAARGYTVVGLDASATAIAAAESAAQQRGLRTTTFAQADVTAFGGYDARFNTIMDSGLFHALPPDKRQDYLQCILRAAAPGASLFILAFSAEAFGHSDQPGPAGLTEDVLRESVSKVWAVDDVRPAKLYANEAHLQGAPGTPPAHVDRDDEGHLRIPGLLLTAHKPR
ncbi:class I SAM-dependent methyltransferase [Mycolicibacterium novocastrense]|uniref:Methyltransferase n=1 Tax=Mycolicibacterium novocastrense TaxID=59813 RepID=A0AAW5SLL5_MYCNV|nr:class I SAM-dependent methyltransferase [Mycolicibacterium novocastrense]MCV7024410.1 class I SAM-dependent methyltransferase [Mycolicibacterium novocastrense]GAT12932.1 methyltransferase [Mycolicibacterium novocastrense]